MQRYPIFVPLLSLFTCCHLFSFLSYFCSVCLACLCILKFLHYCTLCFHMLIIGMWFMENTIETLSHFFLCFVYTVFGGIAFVSMSCLKWSCYGYIDSLILFPLFLVPLFSCSGNYISFVWWCTEAFHGSE